jgi:phosphoribosylformylglycinamidine cyclo-ligase
VAMNVNDILCTGAVPLFFLDYIAYSKLKESVLVDIVRGLNQGCIQSGCSLIGGETAQMPGMYKPGEYDIAGFCVGVVGRKDIIDGSRIRKGDILIGIASSGLHSNGFSLVRKALSANELRRFGRELLTPTRIYVKPVLSLLKSNKDQISGISHITGGAFYDKISRILPADVDARINKASWPIPRIFRLIQSKGNIEDKEIFHTLNMGIGMVLIVRPPAQKIIAKLKEYKLQSWAIGEVVRGSGKVEIH